MALQRPRWTAECSCSGRDASKSPPRTGAVDKVQAMDVKVPASVKIGAHIDGTKASARKERRKVLGNH